MYVKLCLNYPEWLDKYVRAFMKEVVAEELEKLLLWEQGKQPIGMIKDLKGSVTDGIYPDKKKVVLEDFTPVTIGKNLSSYY